MDPVRYREDRYASQLLGPEESVICYEVITKYNHVGKMQERILMVTNKAIYNLTPPSIISSIFSKILSRLKRKTSFDKVYGMSVSRYGFEFVVHVENEHDYRYGSEKKKNQLVMGICTAYCEFHKKSMAFYFKQEFTLAKYCTTKIDIKQNKRRRPRDIPVYLNPEALKHNQLTKGKAQKVFSRADNPQEISIDSFQPLKVLGRGTYGKVMLCQMKGTNNYYAIKSLRKEQIIQKQQVQKTKSEKSLLEMADHPFISSLQYSFQTQEKIFFVMRFIRGGDLYQHLSEKTKFQESQARFYACQILLGIEYIHSEGYIYRDLKPENVMIGEDGYIVITDFGLAKQIKKDQKTYSFAGTPEYMAPEIVKSLGHTWNVDWWSFGIVIYQMLVGTVPFNHPNQNILFQQILEQEVVFPENANISQCGRNLVMSLLNKNPEMRLGNKGIGQIKYHQWFNGISWGDILSKKLKPPFVPKLLGDILDVSRFDSECTSEVAQFSCFPSNNYLLNKFQGEFKDINFNPNFKRQKSTEK